MFLTKPAETHEALFFISQDVEKARVLVTPSTIAIRGGKTFQVGSKFVDTWIVERVMDEFFQLFGSKVSADLEILGKSFFYNGK